MAGSGPPTKKTLIQPWRSVRPSQPGMIIPSTFPALHLDQSDARMAEPSVKEKIAFFKELDRLAELDDLEEDDDKIDEKERQHRDTCRAFFSPKSRSAAAIQFRSHPESQPQPNSRPLTKPPPHPLLRRTTSLPTSTRVSTPEDPRRVLLEKMQLGVIKDTPVTAAQSTTTPLLGGARRGLIAGDSDSVIEETPIPETTRPRTPATLKRSSTMPLPNLSSNIGAKNSPSATTAVRKRKRQPKTSKVVLESAQIFKGLSFYYIPNNDVARTRKLRITRAQEYGAQWVRELSVASHVIVDKNLAYADIKGIAGFNPASSLILVNEDYPIECITFRTLLDPDQQRYRIPGCPSTQAPITAVEEAPATGSPEPGPASLPVKEVPMSNTQQSTIRSEEASAQKTPIAPGIQPTESLPSRPEVTSPDELSEYIELLKEYKDLPLDIEEEDSSSTKDPLEEISEPESASDDERARKRPATRSTTRTAQKTIAFEDRFACNRGGTKDKAGEEADPNARTIEVLQAMCDYYTRVNDHWRTTAYRKAIATLRRQPTMITTEKDAYRLPNIGRRLAEKIEEIVTTNKLRRLDQANAEPLDKTLGLFLKIYGVGLKQATKWVSQGYRSLDDLLEKAKLTANQRLGIEHYDDLNTRIPRQEVFLLGEFVKREAALLDPKIEILTGGSYRRGSDSSGDIDLIVTKKGTESSSELVPFLEALLKILYKKKFLVATLAALHTEKRGSKEPGSKWHGCCVLPSAEPKVWRRIDFLLVPETEYGAALIYFTGNDMFNRSLRLLASKKGMRLNQRGLYKEVMRGRGRKKVTVGELVEGRDEKKIFEMLGVKWREPSERWC
ncbi:hypothetical protein QBC43DRAFT_315065 [Cladorrhinum sp. PSN259]|nr:hypothetical protein QBC43DRAFT_315065 [Cladorrhinum sp. PSN259]